MKPTNQAGSHRLEGKVALVTGGASGMGRSSVERFLAEGASVVVGDLNAEAGTALVAELTEAGMGDRVRFTKTDVAIEDDVAALTELAVDAFGRLDVAFNNAGIGGVFGPITELEVEGWDETFGVLVRSVMAGIKHASRVMIDQGEGGSIINTASIAGVGGGAGPQGYSAAKSAVISLSVTTAVELAPHEIRVNAICPGLIFTPLMHSGMPDQAEDVMRELQPWPHRGEGEDIAALATFLASDDARFITGQHHIIDGGLLAAGPRIQGRMHNTRNLHRMTGMAYGTTGKAATVRRL